MTQQRPALLAVDEGTTGTRAAWVDEAGVVGGLEYRSIDVAHPVPGMVEQDALQLLHRTTEAMRATAAAAQAGGIRIVGIAITQQRLTAVLWDADTGLPLAPAVVWQDTRHAAELARIAAPWRERLYEVIGRPAGFGSPYLWAARLLQADEAVAAAARRGGLRLGTVESWLIWNLSRERVYATSATNASAAGAYATGAGGYYAEWVEELGFPTELLPEIRQDQDSYGTSAHELCGVSVPILGAIGDQQAGAIGLGSIRAGQASCVHGTGSFLSQGTGTERARYRGVEVPGAIPLLAWRADGVSRYLVEGIVPMTGSALEWAAGRLGCFESVEQIGRLAGTTADAGGAMFLPALAGAMTPAIAPRARASLSGLSAGTTSAQLARALIEGIAHSAADGVEANTLTAGAAPDELAAGGGMAASATLLQAQADLTGVPVVRHPGYAVASLRGAAFLAGSQGALWSSLDEAVTTLRGREVFEPGIGDDERGERRAAWQRRLAFELEEGSRDAGG